MSSPVPTIQVARSYLRIAATEATTAAKWLGRAHRTEARDVVAKLAAQLAAVLYLLEGDVSYGEMKCPCGKRCATVDAFRKHFDASRPGSPCRRFLEGRSEI